MIPPERRKWLAQRLYKLAAEQQRAGAEELAAEFRQRAEMLEAGIDSAVEPKRRGRPYSKHRSK